MAQNPEQLSISLEKGADACYSAGETIRGTVTLRKASSLATRSITVLLKGREKVEVRFFETADIAAAVITNAIALGFGAHPHSIPERQIYRERHEFLHETVTLLGAELGEARSRGMEQQQLTAGEHSYPFELILPDALPGSICHSAHKYTAEIKYTLEVRVDVPRGLRDVTLKRHLPMLGNHSVASALAPLLAPNPLAVDGSKSFSGSNGRELTACATLPRRCLLLGETTTVKLDVTNATNVALASIRIKLVTHAKIKAKKAGTEDKAHIERDDVSAVLLRVISPVAKATRLRSLVAGANDSTKRSANFTVYVSPRAETSHKSERLTTFHYLEVELVPKGWLHRSLLLRLPVGVFAPVDGLSMLPQPRQQQQQQQRALAQTQATTVAPTELGEAELEEESCSLAATSDEDVQTVLSEVGSGEVTATTAKGHTALHLACLRGHAGLARCLIAAGCDPSARTQAGFTPLHSAAYAGSAATCLVILKACPPGSIQGLTTGKGSTAAALARKDIPPDSPANESLALLIEEWTPTAAVGAQEEGVDGGEEQESSSEEEEEDVKAEDPPDCSDPPMVESASAAESTPSPSATAAAAVQTREPQLEPEQSPRPSTVPKSRWMPNDASSSCTVCNRAFTLTRRRHHCRGCGRLVCDTCGPKPKAGGERACIKCTISPTIAPLTTSAGPPPSPPPSPSPSPPTQSFSTRQVLSISHPAQAADVLVEQHLEDTVAMAEGADGTYRRLWPTSLVFARYLGEHPTLVRGKRVLELGAGSGAIGLCCTALGAAHVCITDVPGALGPITDNVQRNPSVDQSGAISVAACDWGTHSHIDALLAAAGRFDVIVACEVVYKQDCATLAALLQTMDALLSHGPGATIVLAYKCRTSVPLEDCAFFGPAAERFLVEQTSLRPFEGGNDDVAAGGAAAVDGLPAGDDGRLMLYKYTRACAVHEPPAQQVHAHSTEVEDETGTMLHRIGLPHLGEAVPPSLVSELVQAVLRERPAVLARLRAAGVERLSDRQKIANELSRVARRRKVS